MNLFLHNPVYRLVTRVVNIGTHHIPPGYLQQKLIIANLLAITLLLVSLGLMLVGNQLHNSALIYGQVGLMGCCLLILLLNRMGFNKPARMLLIIAPVVVLVVASTGVQLSSLPGSSYALRGMQFSLLLLAFALFDYREWKLLTASIVVVVAGYFTAPLVYLFTHPELQPMVGSLAMWDGIFSFFIAIMAILYLQQSNLRVEKASRRSIVPQEDSERFLASEASLRQQLKEAVDARDELRQMAEEREENKLVAEANNIALLESERLLRNNLQQLQQKQDVDAKMSALNPLLRWHPGQPIEAWSQALLNELVEDLEGVKAAIYQAVSGSNGKNPYLRLLASYATDGNLLQEIPFGQGLTGQVAKSKQSFYLDNPKVLKASAAAGLLLVVPRANLILPLIHNDTVQGILEVATLHPLNDSQMSFARLLSEQMAASLASIGSQLQIQQLYEEAQEKTLILQTQEEEMRQNILELQSTQEQMRRFQLELEQVNDRLEQRVQERTSELEQAMVGLQTAQNQLVLSEKMAALGQLVAGVAHEMNSPLGAIKASAVNMSDLLPNALHGLPNIFRNFTTQQTALAFQFIEAILNQREHLSSKEERKVRRVHEATLEQAGVVDSSDMARRIADAGFYQDIGEYLEIFGGSQGPYFADLVYSLGQLKMNLDNISLAADKTKKVVFALKSYTHTQEGHQLVPTDLRAHMDTVLIIYNNQLKYGVEVTTDYAENLPEIPTYADELSQVWTNIIQNAIQAMNGVGKLHIATVDVGDTIRVSITDSGPGIPEDKIDKIFEPFFTTKARGEGTGLGLDICRKIVRKHHGELSVRSRPGETTFIVELPKVQVEEPEAIAA